MVTTVIITLMKQEITLNLSIKFIHCLHFVEQF